MVYLLDNLANSCSDYALANILFIVKRVLFMIQIITPIIAILMLSVNVGKMVMNPDDKKGLSSIKNVVIGLFVVFLLPFIINFAMSLTDEKFEFSSCWTKATEIHDQMSSIVETSHSGGSTHIHTSDSGSSHGGSGRGF